MNVMSRWFKRRYDILLIQFMKCECAGVFFFRIDGVKIKREKEEEAARCFIVQSPSFVAFDSMTFSFSTLSMLNEAHFRTASKQEKYLRKSCWNMHNDSIGTHKTNIESTRRENVKLRVQLQRYHLKNKGGEHTHKKKMSGKCQVNNVNDDDDESNKQRKPRRCRRAGKIK